MSALRYVCERCGDDVWRTPPIVGPILCDRCLKKLGAPGDPARPSHRE